MESCNSQGQRINAVMSHIRQQKLPTVFQGAFGRVKSSDDDVTIPWGSRRPQLLKHRNSWPTLGEAGQATQRSAKLPQLDCLREDLSTATTSPQNNDTALNDTAAGFDSGSELPTIRSIGAVAEDTGIDKKKNVWNVEEDVNVHKESMTMTSSSCRSPSPTDQRRIIATLQSTSSSTIKRELDNFRPSPHWTYAVAHAWYQRWEDHVRRHRPTGSEPSSGRRAVTPGPGPVDMDIDDEDRNIYVNEEVWKRLVTWYGVSPSHQLDRRHSTIKDEKIFDVCILSPFSGIIEHQSKKFSHAEEVGYIEYQLRRVFKTDATGSSHQYYAHLHRSGRRSRLWITEKTPVPRFCQLLHRKTTIGDCIKRSSSYIIALEMTDVDDLWPSGEPGDPEGDLDCYSELISTDRCTHIEEDRLLSEQFIKCWNDYVEAGLADLSCSIVDEVNRTTDRYIADIRRTLADSNRYFDHRRKAAEVRLRQLEERLASLAAEEAAIASLEAKLMISGDRLTAEQAFLDNDEKRFRENAVGKSTSVDGDTRIRLDVGGQVYTTSTLTVRRYPNSLLGLAFNGSYQLNREIDGSYFIDRDGRHFRHVLNFMRDGRLEDEIKKMLLNDRSTLRELLCEAKYYRLMTLVEQLVELWKQSQDLDG